MNSDARLYSCTGQSPKSLFIIMASFIDEKDILRSKGGSITLLSDVCVSFCVDFFSFCCDQGPLGPNIENLTLFSSTDLHFFWFGPTQCLMLFVCPNSALRSSFDRSDFDAISLIRVLLSDAPFCGLSVGLDGWCNIRLCFWSLQLH